MRFRSLKTLSFLVVLTLHAPLSRAADATRTTVFHVKGMTCVLCGKAIDRALRGIEGVQDVVIDAESERVTVVAAPSLDPKILETAIAAGGYETEPLPNP